MSELEDSHHENLDSQYALQIAFQTMKERCQNLQARLAAVEEENIRLRLECGNDDITIAERGKGDSENDVLALRVCNHLIIIDL